MQDVYHKTKLEAEIILFKIIYDLLRNKDIKTTNNPEERVLINKNVSK